MITVIYSFYIGFSDFHLTLLQTLTVFLMSVMVFWIQPKLENVNKLYWNLPMYVFSGVPVLLTEGRTDRHSHFIQFFLHLTRQKFSLKYQNLKTGLFAKKKDQNSHYCWKHIYIFLNCIHRKRKKKIKIVTVSDIYWKFLR